MKRNQGISPDSTNFQSQQNKQNLTHRTHLTISGNDEGVLINKKSPTAATTTTTTIMTPSFSVAASATTTGANAFSKTPSQPVSILLSNPTFNRIGVPVVHTQKAPNHLNHAQEQITNTNTREPSILLFKQFPTNSDRANTATNTTTSLNVSKKYQTLQQQNQQRKQNGASTKFLQFQQLLLRNQKQDAFIDSFQLQQHHHHQQQQQQIHIQTASRSSKTNNTKRSKSSNATLIHDSSPLSTCGTLSTSSNKTPIEFFRKNQQQKQSFHQSHNQPLIRESNYITLQKFDEPIYQNNNDNNNNKNLVRFEKESQSSLQSHATAAAVGSITDRKFNFLQQQQRQNLNNKNNSHPKSATTICSPYLTRAPNLFLQQQQLQQLSGSSTRSKSSTSTTTTKKASREYLRSTFNNNNITMFSSNSNHKHRTRLSTTQDHSFRSTARATTLTPSSYSTTITHPSPVLTLKQQQLQAILLKHNQQSQQQPQSKTLDDNDSSSMSNQQYQFIPQVRQETSIKQEQQQKLLLQQKQQYQQQQQQEQQHQRLQQHQTSHGTTSAESMKFYEDDSCLYSLTITEGVSPKIQDLTRDQIKVMPENIRVSRTNRQLGLLDSELSLQKQRKPIHTQNQEKCLNNMNEVSSHSLQGITIESSSQMNDKHNSSRNILQLKNDVADSMSSIQQQQETIPIRAHSSPAQLVKINKTSNILLESERIQFQNQSQQNNNNNNKSNNINHFFLSQNHASPRLTHQAASQVPVPEKLLTGPETTTAATTQRKVITLSRNLREQSNNLSALANTPSTVEQSQSPKNSFNSQQLQKPVAQSLGFPKAHEVSYRERVASTDEKKCISARKSHQQQQQQQINQPKQQQTLSPNQKIQQKPNMSEANMMSGMMDAFNQYDLERMFEQRGKKVSKSRRLLRRHHRGGDFIKNPVNQLLGYFDETLSNFNFDVESECIETEITINPSTSSETNHLVLPPLPSEDQENPRSLSINAQEVVVAAPASTIIATETAANVSTPYLSVSASLSRGINILLEDSSMRSSGVDIAQTQSNRFREPLVNMITSLPDYSPNPITENASDVHLDHMSPPLQQMSQTLCAYFDPVNYQKSNNNNSNNNKLEKGININTDFEEQKRNQEGGDNKVVVPADISLKKASIDHLGIDLDSVEPDSIIFCSQNTPVNVREKWVSELIFDRQTQEHESHNNISNSLVAAAAAAATASQFVYDFDL